MEKAEMCFLSLLRPHYWDCYRYHWWHSRYSLSDPLVVAACDPTNHPQEEEEKKKKKKGRRWCLAASLAYLETRREGMESGRCGERKIWRRRRRKRRTRRRTAVRDR